MTKYYILYKSQSYKKCVMNKEFLNYCYYLKIYIDNTTCEIKFLFDFEF